MPDVPLIPPLEPRLSGLPVRSEPVLDEPLEPEPDGPLDEPDEPAVLDMPELPPKPLPVDPLDPDDALRPLLDCPSPCDELPRSRLEPLDEPEVFWSRSAMMLPSCRAVDALGAGARRSPRAPPRVAPPCA